MDDKKTVYIYTDGSCSGNPGPGGWGAILKHNSKVKKISGGNSDTTNNRMEITAVIEALKALKVPCNVFLYTDSQYVCNSINNGWVNSWKKRGWRKSDNKPALNVDLWEELLTLLEKHNVEFNWVKGHNGHPENEECDSMAVEQTTIYSKKD